MTYNKRAIVCNFIKNLIDKKEAEEWLKTPNEAFDNLSPQELIDNGDLEPLVAMIHFLGVSS